MGKVVVSLFDGMSCGQIALNRVGVNVDKYFASEIDKYAIKVTQKNYPNTVQLGDVERWRDWDIDWSSVDLLIGGSPCQGFSFAGKQLAFDDPRSKLFFVYVDILEHIKKVNPDVKFMLENVRMKKEFLDIITTTLGVKPVMINSSLVSAQNRIRYYWTNITNIHQPEDKEILLKDIIHEHEPIGVAIKGNHGEWFAKKANFLLNKKYSSLNADKCITLTARQYANWNGNFWFQVLSKYVVPFDKTFQLLEKEVERGKVGYFRKDSQTNRVYHIHNKSVTLCGDAGGGAAKMGQYLFGCIAPDRVNKKQNGQRFNDGKKFYTLTDQDKHGVLVEGYIRKLTPMECERLQTVPDNYTQCVSDTQRYKMLGNGWTVDVITHIFKNLGG